jgi:hypothetical protein
MEYFSSNLDSFPDAGNSPGKTLWPYTLDNGVRGLCYEHCDVKRKYPGIWSLPMNTLYGPDTTLPAKYLMDANLTGDELYDTYMANFLRHYNGNRAPFGIYTHPNWFISDPSRIDTINRFLAAVLKMSDVYVVSMENVIRYMKNPVAAGSPLVPFPCNYSAPIEPLPPIRPPPTTTSNPIHPTDITTPSFRTVPFVAQNVEEALGTINTVPMAFLAVAAVVGICVGLR